jgi:hypothetical protein
LKGDGVAEGLQAGDEAAGQAFGVAALVVVAAEFAVGRAGGEHVPVGDEHRVLDGAERAAVPEAGLEALVLGLEVAAFGAGGGQRDGRLPACGSLVPATSASSIARPETPRMSVATQSSLMPVSSSALCSRLASRWRSAICVLRYRVRFLSVRIGLGGTKLALSSPASSRWHSHCASDTSVLRPGTFLT